MDWNGDWKAQHVFVPVICLPGICDAHYEHCFADWRCVIYYRCPWTGGPIGKENKRSFFYFLCCMYPLLIVDAYWLISWWRSFNPEAAVDDDSLLLSQLAITMRISLVTLLCVLTTWHALVAVNAADTAVVRRQPHLRKLQSDFDATEAPGNNDDEDIETVPAGDVFDSEPGTNNSTNAPEAEAAGGDDEGGDDEPMENLGDEGDGEDTPAESPVEAEGDGDDEGNPADTVGGDDETEAPGEVPSEAGETPTAGGNTFDAPTEEAPSATGGDDVGGDDAPSAAGGETGGDTAPSAAGGGDDFAPVATPTEDRFPTEPAEAPTEDRFPTPTAERPTFDEPTGPTPTFSPPTAPTPTFAAPTAPFPTPTFPQPTLKPYVPNDEDDPIMGPTGSDESGSGSGGSGTSNNDEWGWDNSTVEELEHDQTVIIALSVTFGVMFFFSVFVAYQMLENPHGCYATGII
ncbi:MAG: hypothetical protein SGARI_000594 [Bacillariaceae sp.]